MQEFLVNFATSGQRATGVRGVQCSNVNTGFGRRQSRTGRVHHQIATGTQFVAATLSHSISQSTYELTRDLKVFRIEFVFKRTVKTPSFLETIAYYLPTCLVLYL